LQYVIDYVLRDGSVTGECSQDASFDGVGPPAPSPSSDHP